MFSDAPTRLTIPRAGTQEVTLRHEHGIVHRILSTDGTIEPPLLWDGAWRVETQGSAVKRIRVGATIDTRLAADAETLGERLLACWGVGTGAEPPRATTPDGVRCTQSLVTDVAARRGYDEAAAMIEHARKGLTDDQNLWGRYCNIAGEAAAAGAVFGGADGRTLIREQRSFCDYSVPHGVGAATVILHAEEPIIPATAVCAEDPLSSLPALARTSQCWHGVGMGLARLHRLDLGTAAGDCRRAPEDSSRMNCIEGLLAFARTYRLRGPGAVSEWRALALDGETCGAIGSDPSLLDTCYRSIGQTFARDAVDRSDDSAQTREDAVGAMTRTCAASPVTHQTFCWAGVGTVVAASLHQDLSDIAEISRWLATCDSATDTASREVCYERAALGLLANDQLVDGLDVETLTGLVPPAMRAGLREKLLYWIESLGGRST